MYRTRIRLTTSCKDTDLIPKVADAGEIKEEGGVVYQVMHNGVKVTYGDYHGKWMGEIIHTLRGHHEH